MQTNRKANLKSQLLLASALCLLNATHANAQVRSQTTTAPQRNQPAPQFRNLPNQVHPSPRSRPGTALRFNQPFIQVPNRVTPGAAPLGSSGIILGGNAGGMINPNQGGIAPVVGGVPAAANPSQAGQQPVSYPVYAGAGAGGGGGGVVAPGGPHTQMVIQMQPGENLYIYPKAATVAAQRLRAQHEAAMRAAAATNSTSNPADAVADLNVVPTMNNSETPPELQPEFQEPETELTTASPTAPQWLIDLEETDSETQENTDADKPKNTEPSTVVPISVVSGPLFSNDTLLEWQRQNAEKGNPQSQYAMGLRYLTGIGVEQNEDRARDWFEKASKQGELRARTKLRELSKRLES